MPRLALKNREIKRRLLADKFLKLRQEFKKILKSQFATMQEKMEASAKLSQLPRDSSRCRQSNRCRICYRGRGVFNKRFKLCRLCLRKLAREGMLPGLRKASW